MLQIKLAKIDLQYITSSDKRAGKVKILNKNNGTLINLLNCFAVLI